MPLSSPRFQDERELIAVEAGHAILRRGSTGRHVHLVQMALIDLGFVMPISILSQDYSPDGVYGAETEAIVKAFQRSVPAPGLKPDGVVGQLTLRELDKRHPKFTHRINLHFRSLSLSDIPFRQLMSNTAQAYAQYGIEVWFASGESLDCRRTRRDDSTSSVKTVSGRWTAASSPSCTSSGLRSQYRYCSLHR